MPDWLAKQLKALEGARWLVPLGVVVAVGVFAGAYLLPSAVNALFLAIGAAAAVMALGGVGRRFWQKEELSDAQLPGVGFGFEAAQEGLSGLNGRVDNLTKDVNERLLDLERATFKEGPSEVDPSSE